MLLLLFAGSGCSALIYEIVWYQLLQLAIGSTAVSLGVLLATFMGGLCLGSLVLPRLKLAADSIRCACMRTLELGIGVCGILVLFVMPLIDRSTSSAVGHGLPGMLLRALIAAVCLLPPTILMGASLPAIVALDRGVRRAAWHGGDAVRRQYGGRGDRAACWRASTCCGIYDMAMATYRGGGDQFSGGGWRVICAGGQARRRSLRVDEPSDADDGR